MSMSAEDLELIAAGYTAILGAPVVSLAPLPNRVENVLATAESARVGLPQIKIGVHDLFHCTYQCLYPRNQLARLESASSGEDLFDITVNTITGGSTTLQVSENQTMEAIKAAVEGKLNIPAREQRLAFNGKRVSDHHTVSNLQIPKGGVIVLAPGDGPFEFDINDFDARYNYDFTNKTDNGKKYVRGGKVYTRPYGWKRFAVKALGRYGSNTWLGPDGIRTQEANGEWPVSYHGTNKGAAEKIIETGYKKGSGAKYGEGVYSTPSLEFVERKYAKEFQYKGHTWKIALQNRINPDPDHIKIIEKTWGGVEFWISPKQDIQKGIYDLRPYGLLFKKVK